MKLAGRVLVKLAEMKDGYILWNNNLIIATRRKEGDAIELYRIKKKLTKEEMEAIAQDPKKGIKKAKEKFRECGPIIIKADNVYLDDTIVIQTKTGAAIIGELEE